MSTLAAFLLGCLTGMVSLAIGLGAVALFVETRTMFDRNAPTLPDKIAPRREWRTDEPDEHTTGGIGA